MEILILKMMKVRKKNLYRKKKIFYRKKNVYREKKNLYRKKKFYREKKNFWNFLKPSLDIIARGNQSSNLTELDRLSFVVQNIDMECAIVPKDAYKSTPNGELVKNIGYKGLKSDEISLENFRHFRNIPEQFKIKCMVEQGENYTNFLQGLENDLPCGRWSMKLDHSKLKVKKKFLKFFLKFL